MTQAEAAIKKVGGYVEGSYKKEEAGL